MDMAVGSFGLPKNTAKPLEFGSVQLSEWQQLGTRHGLDLWKRKGVPGKETDG